MLNLFNISSPNSCYCKCFIVFLSDLMVFLDWLPLFFLIFFWPQGEVSLSRFCIIHSDSACPQSYPLWKMPDSNPGPLPQLAGALPISQHIFFIIWISYFMCEMTEQLYYFDIRWSAQSAGDCLQPGHRQQEDRDRQGRVQGLLRPCRYAVPKVINFPR